MNALTLSVLGFVALAIPILSRSEVLASPEVHPDATVTFRLRDFGQRSARVVLEAQRAPLEMSRDHRGLWAVTTGPLEPDYYGYFFEVDGVALVDPGNTCIKPNLLNLSSILHVPGPASLPWEVGDGPHGEVHHHVYHSSVVGDQRDYYVYTPPGYDPTALRRYPVLYLCHGYSDDAAAWTQVGRANVILDNLISLGKARPMIIVMPLGYGVPEIVVPGSGKTLEDSDSRDRNYRLFHAALVSELMPRIEAEYRVAPGGEACAIAGLSMGGAESLLAGLNGPGRFAWVGSFSAGGLPEDYAAAFPRLDASANQRLRLLWIACGTDDPWIRLHRDFSAWLDHKGIRHVKVEVPGAAHTWPLWRRNLATFTSLLFGSDNPTGGFDSHEHD